MSNESENKRIDLTQFEGMTKGPWHFAGAFGGMMLVTAYPHDMIVRQNGEGDCRLRLGEINSPYDGEAIAQLPDLIAELKRCYEELDKWTNYATYVENVNMDCHQDACAEAGFLWKCTDCGAHFELPENGIYECEFGCDASE